MPIYLLAVPAAIALAWLALKGGQPGGLRAAVGLDAADGLAAGVTGRLDNGEEEPGPERHELPFASGGELGGPYGPGTQTQAPSGSLSGSVESPAATQTYVSNGSPSGGFGLPSQPLLAGTPLPGGGYASGQPGFQYIGLDAPPVGSGPAPTTAMPPRTSGHVEA